MRIDTHTLDQSKAGRPDSHIVVLSGGAHPDPFVSSQIARRLGPLHQVIAADSGLEHGDIFGLTVTTAIGDFDSVDPAVLKRAKVQGVEIVPYPAEKDATDLELALELAVGRGATRITVLSGGAGSRLDHFLGEIGVLAAPFLAGCEVVAWFGSAKVCIVLPQFPLTVLGTIGDNLTLLPVTPEVHGVSSVGLAYPLDDAVLFAWRTRGVSNVFVSEHVSVSITSGVLLAVQPYALGGAE